MSGPSPGIPGCDAKPIGASSGLERVLESDAAGWVLREGRLVHAYLRRPQGTTVSVIMPTWNRAHVIRRAVESVLRQRYRNYELLIADDGSEDGTGALLHSCYAREPRIRCLRARHGGPSRARNLALRHATGELIAYLDSDNEWSENYLLIMVNALVDAAPSAAAYCGIRVVDRIGGGVYVRLRPFERERLESRNYIDINVFVHARALYDRLGGFDPEIQGVEDWDLVLRYTSDERPRVVDCVLATYYLERALSNLTTAVDLERPYQTVRARHRRT